jgi:hypothetical protein
VGSPNPTVLPDQGPHEQDQRYPEHDHKQGERSAQPWFLRAEPPGPFTASPSPQQRSQTGQSVASQQQRWPNCKLG